MYYLNSDNLGKINRHWDQIIDVIEHSVAIMSDNDFSQPVKPYLRYKNHNNRIIAMPAYIGGDIDIAGIKWIASFPQNIRSGLKRANSVTILNNAATGEPVCIINSTLVSEVRTAAVSGAVLRKFLGLKNERFDWIVSITGFGPIGQMHLEMITALLGDRIQDVFLYDPKGVDMTKVPAGIRKKTVVCECFQELYDNADIFITATVSDERYVTKKPKPGSLHLNVSLRDYSPEFARYVDFMIVDDWEEVCRENTDIEMMYSCGHLKKEDAISLIDLFGKKQLKLNEWDVVMFNPMGMAVFDMAIGKYYFDLSKISDCSPTLL